MRPRLARRHRWTIAAAVAIPALVLAPVVYVTATTAAQVHPASTDTFAAADAALVLGARVYPDGQPSRFLRERVAIGVDLYQAGLVDTLIMSGDGADSSGYGEPTVMRALAESMGVPADAILEDPEGFDTYASCARARAVQGVDTVIIATQQFHAARALWLCERAGMRAQAAYPPATHTFSTVQGRLREIPATAKAMIDTATGRTS